ncbi:hypothetical protein [Acinetobacter lwoffii]|uniref:hypothetical protein n=1 Tax=Acinetobacter lwoffii TaxID=28090 RepID=UPI00110CC3F2|nr:hypothetical protein [Acinetobacter lwoffii]TMS45877.1 hypothetical protein FGQ54_10565 [Acinetobacter lwoffii]
MLNKDKSLNSFKKKNLIKFRRDIFIVDISEPNYLEVIDRISDDNFSNLILLIKDKKSHRRKYIDIGSYCFEVRKKRINHELESEVNIESINTTRIKGLKAVLLYILDKNINNVSLKTDLMNLGNVIDRINEKFKGYDFGDVDACKYLYIEFTKLLLHKVYSGGSLTRGFTLQHICAIFLAKSCNVSLIEIERTATKINDKTVNRPYYNDGREEDINKYISRCIILFETISNKLMRNEELPFVVNFNKFNDFLIFDTSLYSASFNKDKYKILFDENHKLKKIDDIAKIVKAENPNQNLRKNYLYAAAERKSISLKKINNEKFHESSFKLKLADLAIFAFSQAFVASTSCNVSVLIQLRDYGTISAGKVKGKRLYAVKARGNYREQNISYSVEFQKHFKLYRKFIEFLKKELIQYFDERVINKLFFKILPRKNVKINPYDEVYINNYYKTLSRIFDVDKILNTVLRNNVGNFYSSNTNDSTLTANKLGNSRNIAIKNYTDVSFKMMAEEVSGFLNKVQDSAILKGRITSKNIGVNINEVQKEKNTIGYCKSVKPILKDGFNNDSIQPNCSNFESCLFCENFTLFLNENDFRRLLSFKMILSQLSESKDHILQIKYRIDEIINLVIKLYPQTEEIINKVINETEEGLLDEFWENHLKMLIDLEVL